MDPVIASTPRLKADANVSIYGFLREFQRVVPAVYALEHSGNAIVVRAAYPDEFILQGSPSNENPASEFIDTITYQVVRREPGSLQDRPFDAKRDLKPRIRETQRVTTTDGEFIEIRAQWFDNLVQFDTWTKSNEEADAFIEWLEKFMVRYAGYFKLKGVQEMFYFRGGRFSWGTSEEDAMQRWRNPFKVRSATYFVRTEALWYLNRDEIERIIVTLDVVE